MGIALRLLQSKLSLNNIDNRLFDVFIREEIHAEIACKSKTSSEPKAVEA